MTALDQDHCALRDTRVSAEYRSLTAHNLLYRFFLETRPEDALTQDQGSAFAGLSFGCLSPHKSRISSDDAREISNLDGV